MSLYSCQANGTYTTLVQNQGTMLGGIGHVEWSQGPTVLAGPADVQLTTARGA